MPRRRDLHPDQARRHRGLVTPLTVGEQVLYEIGDPGAYMLPRCSGGFLTGVAAPGRPASRRGQRRARGYRPTAEYKVSATYQDGYRARSPRFRSSAPTPARKAERTAEELVKRARMLFRARNLPDFTATHVEALGAEASYGAGAKSRATREVLLRLVVDHPRPATRSTCSRRRAGLGRAGLLAGHDRHL